MKKIFTFLSKDFLITFSILFFFLLAISILWKENTIISIFILIIILSLLVLSAVGPNSLLNFIFEQSKDGTKFSFNRHILTKEENKFANDVEYLNINDFENQEIYEQSIKRSFEKKSDFDFLIISTKLWREKI